MRKIAPLLLISALAGCRDRDINELLIHNLGSVTVVVDVIYEKDRLWKSSSDRRDIFEVPPNSLAERDYPRLEEMDIVITRKFDGALLFVGEFDQEDFSDEHGELDIFIYP